jgi:rhamnogalacturonan endolyase
MKHYKILINGILVVCFLALSAYSAGPRIMEKLGRGLVAVKSGSGYYLSWRLFGPEQGTDIAFNVYKGETKLNDAPITASTNYQDNSGGTGDYTIKAVKGGAEEATGAKPMAVLPNNYIEIPLKDGGSRKIHLAYVADLDGDGEYEYVVDRIGGSQTQYFEAYHRTTGFMWRVDMGPNSTNQALTDPGAAAIGCGHADNEGAYDIDCDGYGEALVKGANGTIFGDGKVLTAPNNTNGYLLALDGKTGAEKARIEVPHDLDKTWSCTGHFSIAYWDGVHPGLMFKAKAGGARTMADYAYDWDMESKGWKLRWNSGELSTSAYPNNHNIRCLDVNADGIDEYINGGYCRSADGKVLWNQASQGIKHGDRWHVGDMDPSRPGLEGCSIGQESTYDLAFYDAIDGKVTRKIGSGGLDVNRGTAGDVDPTSPGYEFWSAATGIYNVDGSKNLKPGNGTPGTGINQYDPAVNFRIWWDGDVLSECLDCTILSKYAYPGMPSGAGMSNVTLAGRCDARNAVPLYGDMFGDWREEVLVEQTDSKSMRIYTTTIPTEKRLYCLMHNPEYRNSMCEKGYIQSHMIDYYLGDGMTDPPKPNMTYPGVVAALPGPDTRKTGRVLASSEGASMMVMANKSFTIPGASAGAARSMSVYTCTGKLVARAPVSENNVNLEKQFGLSNGMFVVKLAKTGER